MLSAVIGRIKFLLRLALRLNLFISSICLIFGIAFGSVFWQALWGGIFLLLVFVISGKKHLLIIAIYLICFFFGGFRYEVAEEKYENSGVLGLWGKEIEIEGRIVSDEVRKGGVSEYLVRPEDFKKDEGLILLKTGRYPGYKYGQKIRIYGFFTEPEEFEDFSYKDYDYPEIKAKKFQVMLVEYDSRYIPFLSKKAGDGIKDNVPYVRRGTNSDEATHDELQKIINARLETGFSSKHILDLSEHLEQLKILYRSKRSGDWTLASRALEMLEGDKLQDYRSFIDVLIEKKKKKIEEDLGLL